MFLSKQKKNIDRGDVSLTYLIGICGGAIGAFMLRPIMKSVEVFVFWETYRNVTASELLGFIFGEIVFFGGLLGGLTAILIFCTKFKIEILPSLDLFAPALALGHAVGRIGCFLGGCCYGIEVSHNHPFAVIYPPGTIWTPTETPLLAVPLLEAAFLLALFAVLAVIFLKTKTPGLCAPIYLIVYPAGRFALEFFRGDSVRGYYGSLSTSQYISIVTVILGALYLLWANQINKRRCSA
jgi:phosphatidylglycerol:prolipoprotein diacylglycerol transferase